MSTQITGWKFWLFFAVPWVIGVITIVRWF